MGCGVSRSNEGLVVLRSPHHSHTKPKFLIEGDTSQASNLHQPPAVQKINTAELEAVHHQDAAGNDDPLWIGSPSFREYVQSVPEDADISGKEIVIGTRGGQKLICNGEVCVRGDLGEKEQADTRGGGGGGGGRYRKVFQVHRVAFWHGRAWHPGHPKATRTAH